MSARWRAWGARLAAVLALAGCGGSSTSDMSDAASGDARTAAQAVAAAPVAATVVGLVKQSETRVGRTTFDYVFKITVTNGATALQAVTARLTAAGAGTTIVDGDVAVGNLAPNASVTPADTITLRQDRTQAFVPAALVWSMQGTAAGGTAAALTLTPSQWVVGAGSPVTVASSVLDASGQPLPTQPAVTYTVTAQAGGATGALPTVNGASIAISADTRGVYHLTGKVAGSGVVASLVFTVLQNGTQSRNAGQLIGLSTALAGGRSSLARLRAAVAAGDTAGTASAAAALQAAVAGVDTERVRLGTPYEPDVGFVPVSSKLAANGYPSTAADAAFATATGQLRAKLQQVTQLLAHPGADSTANTAQIQQLQADLTAIAATLAGAGARPTPFGLADGAETVSGLLSQDVPLALKAIAAAAVAEAQSPASGRRSAQAAGRVQPAQFLITGLLDALGPMGQLIDRIYGDYLNQIENMAIIMGAKGLLDEFADQNVDIAGVLSGAALLGPYAYHYPNSYIELGTSVSLADAQAADVYLIGGDAVNKARGLVGALSKKPKSIKELYDALNGVVDALREAGDAYDKAHQQPNSVAYDSFDNFGCLPDVADSCIELHYDNGFENVSGGNVSFTVLILVRVGGPRPQIGSFLTSFAPGT